MSSIHTPGLFEPLITGLLLSLLALPSACSSPASGDSSADHPPPSVASSGASGMGSGGSASAGLAIGGGQASTAAGAGGSMTSVSHDEPPCHPDDNSASLSSDVISDLPSRMDFTVLDAPSSASFTGNGSNGDLRIGFSQPVTDNHVFPTGYAIDPLDTGSARLELVAAAGPFGGLYGAETGAKLYAELNGSVLTLTFCDVRFHQVTELPLPDELRVSARFVARPR
ncbi:MAG TPA: hypothetical protein VER12_02460 [Polyangiaceae bacterium]|nr:hypothetical protein [Polyangiaceae bacterium]